MRFGCQTSLRRAAVRAVAPPRPRGEGSAARVAYANYVAVAGDGYALGDGVIPVGCAHLEGAEQVTLDGVLHSINEAGTTLPTDRWYGSEAVVDRWLGPALEKMGFAEET